MRSLATSFVLMCAIMASSLTALAQPCPQQFQPCPGGQCQPPIVQAGEVFIPETVAAAVATTPHVRCIAGNSCGSGTICGADADGAYVVTNAHVTGTPLGRQVHVDCVVGDKAQRLSGRTVMTGYSDSRMVDFSIVYVPGLTASRYMPMLKTEPSDQPYATTGGPRCIWPQVTKPFNNPRNYGDGLITGSPNAIGGQSGSAIYNSEGQQIALLTWSMNGLCAGQKTSKLWQVATSRNMQLADPRPEALRELSDSLSERPVTRSGVFGSCRVFETAGTDDRPLLENMIQNVVGSAMDELPIWVVPAPTPDPTPDPKPDPKPDCPPCPDCPACPDCPDSPDAGPADPNCVVLDPTEKALIDAIRAQKETGLRDGEKATDWLRIISLIMELIKAIQEGRAG